MARKKNDAISESTRNVVMTGTESEVTSAVLEMVRKVLAESSSTAANGQHRLFPNGVGLFEVQATIDLPKFTFSARIADVQYPAPPPKPTGRGIRILGIADDILAYCVSLDTGDDPVMKDCNAFVKKVGAQFGVTIPDKNADGIVDSFNGPPFSKTTMDAATAMSWANDGLVVGGMKLGELNPKYGTKYKNGHVAIVHAMADPAHPGFPMASWGALGSRGHANWSIRQSFPAAACDDSAVHFAYAVTA